MWGVFVICFWLSVIIGFLSLVFNLLAHREHRNHNLSNKMVFTDFIRRNDNCRSEVFGEQDTYIALNGKYFHIGFVENSELKEIKRSISIVKSVQIFEDKEELVRTSKGSLVGRALLGGALLGGVGAVIGALTSKRVDKSKCSSIELKVFFDDGSRFTIELLNDSYEKFDFSVKSDRYLRAMRNAIELSDSLTNCASIVSNKNSFSY